MPTPEKLPAEEKNKVPTKPKQVDDFYDELTSDLDPYTAYEKETGKIDQKKTRERIKKEIEERLYEKLREDFPDTNMNSVLFDDEGNTKKDVKLDLYKFLQELNKDGVILSPKETESYIEKLTDIILEKRFSLIQHDREEREVVLGKKSADSEAEKWQSEWQISENLIKYFNKGVEIISDREKKVADLKKDASDLRAEVFELQQELKRIGQEKMRLRSAEEIDGRLDVHEKQLRDLDEQEKAIRLKLNGGEKTAGLQSKLGTQEVRAEYLEKVDYELITEILKHNDLLPAGKRRIFEEKLRGFIDKPISELREMLQDFAARQEKNNVKEATQGRLLSLRGEVDFFEESFEDAVATIEAQMLIARKAKIEAKLTEKIAQLSRNPNNAVLVQEVQALKDLLQDESMDQRRIKAIERVEREILSNPALGAELQVGLLEEGKFLADRLPKIAQKKKDILSLMNLLGDYSYQRYEDFFRKKQTDARRETRTFTEKITEEQKKIDDSKQEIVVLTETFNTEQEKVDDFKQKLQVLTEQLSAQRQKREGLIQEFESFDQIGVLDSPYITEEEKTALRLNAEKIKLDVATDLEAADLEYQKTGVPKEQEVTRLNGELEQSMQEIAMLNAEIERLTQEINQSENEISGLNAEIRSLTQETENAGLEIKRLQESKDAVSKDAYNLEHFQRFANEFSSFDPSSFVNASEIRRASLQQMLLARATIQSKTATPEAKSKAEEDFIFHKAVVDLLDLKIHSPMAIRQNKEIMEDAKKRQSQAIETQKQAGKELFDSADEKIKTAIAQRKEEIMEKNGDCLYMMDQVVLFIRTNGAHMSEDLFKFLNDSRNTNKATELNKSFRDAAKNDLTDKELKKLIKKGYIKNAAVFELCAEARAIHARNLAMDKNRYDEFMEERYGRSHGVNAFNMRRSREDYNRETDLNAKMTPRNVFRFFAFFYGAATTLANSLVSFRSGDWSNEYIALGGGLMYASYKGGDWIDNARDPEGMRFRLATDLSQSYKGQKVLECFRNNNEMEIVNMIDWKKVQKDPGKYFKAEGDKERTKWQEQSLPQFPLEQGVDQKAFEELVKQNSTGKIVAKQRYEFLKFIAHREKILPNKASLQEMVYHAKRL